jgi:hypothetical protein
VTTLAPHPLRQPKSDISDFGHFKVPNSGKPEFGRGSAPSPRRAGRGQARAQRGPGEGHRLRTLRLIYSQIAASFLAVVITTRAHAHGFGERYDLPIPLSFYLAGAAAAVIVSFLIAALFVRAGPTVTHARADLIGERGATFLSPVVLLVKFLALVIFFITIAAGFFGNQNPYRNIAPTMVWIIWWVGLAYICAFVGDVAALINPWRTLFELLERVYRRLTRAPTRTHDLPYPASLGVWPAVALLFAFAWLELIFPNPAIPAVIAAVAVPYTISTLLGMLLFGRETWLQNAELFTVVFGTFARFAPLELRAQPTCRVTLRPYAAGLTGTGAVSSSMMAFVLLLLATVLYDGALGTPEWGMLEGFLADRIAGLGDYKLFAIRTAGLLVFWLVLLGAFLGVSGIVSLLTARALAPLAIARRFALSLVPIAIGYHLAHYLTFLLIQGQYIIPLASDPFGWGWNLFGTAGYRVNIAIVGARFAWYAAVTAILLGHIAAVFVAHLDALQIFGTRTLALRSQAPLTALMVLYTLISLSILAEPVVERRTPAQPQSITAEIAIPPGAVLPEVASGELKPVAPGSMAKERLIYRAMGSAFHDGTRTSMVDLLYAYIFAYRWSAESREAHFDALVAAASASMRAQLVGVRPVGRDTTSKSYRLGDLEVLRELFILEVYLSRQPLEREQDAAIAPPWSTLPWHVLVLMEEAVERGWAAFSEAAAKKRGVPWLDLVRSEPLGNRLAELVDNFARDGYRPERLQSLVTADDARKRWAALSAFYKERGHFLVTNGPYLLKAWTPESATLEAFRDLSYPLGVGSFDAYADPRRGFITKLERADDAIRIFGDIEVVQKHMRSTDIVRRPLQSLDADILRRSAPQCRYMITDGEGRVLLAGLLAPSGDGTFRLDIAGKLPPGRFMLSAELLVNGNAMNAEIRTFPIEMR